MSSRRKSRPPKRVHFELSEIAAQHINREREQELKRTREEQRLMSVTSFNDAVVAAVAKGFLDAAAEVETVKDDLRKTAKVVQVRRLEGGRREGGFFGRPILRVRGRREVHDGVARERGERR